jgi:hypothetical protein
MDAQAKACDIAKARHDIRMIWPKPGGERAMAKKSKKDKKSKKGKKK